MPSSSVANLFDYNFYKNLSVNMPDSSSGTYDSSSSYPRINRAIPIKITSGTGDETGTGEIAIDWTDVSSKADIAVFDENDELLDYYFESFDASDSSGGNSAVIWVYKEWVQDGTVQAKVAYGNGPSDNSVTASTVFDKESNLQAGYLFNESSGDLFDVTSNNNDGTVNGATQDVDGIVGGAYSFDGNDDYVTTAKMNVTSAGYSVSFWFKTSSSSYGRVLEIRCDADSIRNYLLIQSNYDGGDNIRFFVREGGTSKSFKSDVSPSDGNWHHCIFLYDGSTVCMYIDGSEQSTTLSFSWSSDWTADSDVAIATKGGTSLGSDCFYGDLDDVRMYSVGLFAEEVTGIYSATKSSPDFFSQQTSESTADSSSSVIVGDSSSSVISDQYLSTKYPPLQGETTYNIITVQKTLPGVFYFPDPDLNSDSYWNSSSGTLSILNGFVHVVLNKGDSSSTADREGFIIPVSDVPADAEVLRINLYGKIDSGSGSGDAVIDISERHFSDSSPITDSTYLSSGNIWNFPNTNYQRLTIDIDLTDSFFGETPALYLCISRDINDSADNLDNPLYIFRTDILYLSSSSST